MLHSCTGFVIGTRLGTCQCISRLIRMRPSTYLLGFALSLTSGFLFGAVPVKQVLRTNSYQVIKAGADLPSRRITARDMMLAVQIAICAVLVTSSLVAVRGLAHAMHSNFGFDPHNSMLVSADLRMAGR